MSIFAARIPCRRYSWCLPAVALVLVAACGGDDGGGPTDPAAPRPVAGQVTKGPVEGAEVTISALTTTDGGATVGGPWTTDALGAWSGEIAAGASGPFNLVARGGSYTDEATGDPVDLGSRQLVGYSGTGSGQVTPYTHTLALAARARVENEGDSAAAAWTSVIGSFQAAFGFDPTTTVPSTSGSTAARTYQALLGGISELLDTNPALSGLSGAEPFDLVLAVSQDLADGALDGRTALGEAIDIETTGGTEPWPALDNAGIGVLVSAANTYAARTPGLEDIDLGTIDLDFDDPVGGSGSGSLTITGPGVALLPGGTFTPLAFSTNETSLAWSTGAVGYAASLGVGRSPGNASQASLVFFTAAVGQTAYGWQIVDIGDFSRSVGGVSIDGQTVTFTNVTLPGTTGTDLSITLNGQVGP